MLTTITLYVLFLATLNMARVAGGAAAVTIYPLGQRITPGRKIVFAAFAVICGYAALIFTFTKFLRP